MRERSSWCLGGWSFLVILVAAACQTPRAVPVDASMTAQTVSGGQSGSGAPGGGGGDVVVVDGGGDRHDVAGDGPDGAAGDSGRGMAGHEGSGGSGGSSGNGSGGSGGSRGGGSGGNGGSGGSGGSSGPTMTCGNGVKELDEPCDLGAAMNTGAYNGCNPNCTLGPRCGDGVVNGSEACDKGSAMNTGAYGGCNATCALGPRCGDGAVNGSEACDKGMANNDTTYDGCTTSCTLGPRCGDAAVNGSEACDKGSANNNTTYDGCTTSCTLGPRCGDGIVNGTEACDRGASNGSTVGACNPDCSGTVRSKHIQTVATKNFGNLGGIAGADSLCQSTFGSAYRAFIVDGVSRVATVTAFKGDGQVGWVLQKFTQYVDANGVEIWTTDRSALLGVTNGTPGTLKTSVYTMNDDGAGVWSGMDQTYTSGLDCNHWTSSDANTVQGLPMNANATTVGQTFPNNGGISLCGSYSRRLFCAEQ